MLTANILEKQPWCLMMERCWHISLFLFCSAIEHRGQFHISPHPRVCVCVDQKSTVRCLSQFLSVLFFDARKAQFSNRIAYLASELQGTSCFLPHSHSSAWIADACNSLCWPVCGGYRSKSRSSGLCDRPLPTEPSPQTPKDILSSVDAACVNSCLRKRHCQFNCSTVSQRSLPLPTQPSFSPFSLQLLQLGHQELSPVLLQQP